MITSWMFFALVGSLFQAGFVEANRIFRVDARLLNFWHVVAILVLFIPLIPYMSWPDERSFYWLAMAVAFGMAISMQILFGLARRHNGRVSSMYLPLEVAITYGLWFALYPTTAEIYNYNPMLQNATFLAFCLFSMSLLMIRRNDIGWSAFIAVIPVAIFFAVRTVFSKIALTDIGDDMIGHTLSFTFLIYLGVLPIAGLLLKFNGGFSKTASLPPIKASIICAFLALLSFVFYMLGVTLAPNPAFITMIFMLVPVWLLLVHILTGVEDDASPWAGMVMIIGGMVLIWFTA